MSNSTFIPRYFLNPFVDRMIDSISRQYNNNLLYPLFYLNAYNAKKVLADLQKEKRLSGISLSITECVDHKYVKLSWGDVTLSEIDEDELKRHPNDYSQIEVSGEKVNINNKLLSAMIRGQKNRLGFYF